MSSTPLALWQAGHLTHIGGRSVEKVSRIGSPFVGAVGINQRRLNIVDRRAQHCSDLHIPQLYSFEHLAGSLSEYDGRRPEVSC